MISEFVEYVKQAWKNKPNVSSPLNADRLNHMEDGIENNSKKIKETVTAVNELIDAMEWVKVGELSGSIIGKSIPPVMVGVHKPEEYLVKWRLFPTHPWNYVTVNERSLSTTDKHMGSFYFSPTYYASFSFILSGEGLSVESSYTGGKHGSTDLANPENAKIVLYYK